MKRVVLILSLLSLPAFAGIHCQDSGSTLKVEYLGFGKISVIFKKDGQVKRFNGVVVLRRPSRVMDFGRTYDLFQGKSPVAKLKISEYQMQLPASCGRRLCDLNEQNFEEGPKTIEAGLTFEGQELHFYDCQETP